MTEPTSRRLVLARLALLGAAVALAPAAWSGEPAPPPSAAAGKLEKITVSVPGPRNISYLPVDLIPKIGADRAEGVEMHLLHTGGGGVALKQMATRNSDFAVAGVPAHQSLRAHGEGVVTLMPVNDLPLFILMVRSELKDQVKRIADLKGRVIGVNTSSMTSKTTSQQLAELLLSSDGVPPNEARILPAGQSWEEQSSQIMSGRVDAIMGDEPYASRLLEQGRVFFLASLSDPDIGRRVPGAGFLHAALAARPDTVTQHPEKVRRMTDMLRRSLGYIASHAAEEVVAALGVEDPEEKRSLVYSLNQYPRAFSKDGRFSTQQLQETDAFFHGASPGDPQAQALKLESMVDDRWAGRKE
ncbi:MAG: ABC transporter substrate-binding protein [Magnetococcales bacterium]|nr:ABC transporter substrate-binding protein [Magnetococcales bacterium]